MKTNIQQQVRREQRLVCAKSRAIHRGRANGAMLLFLGRASGAFIIEFYGRPQGSIQKKVEVN